MILNDAIESNEILSKDIDKRDILQDFIIQYCKKYDVNILMADNEENVLKHLPKILNEISEAATMLNPTNVITEKVMTMPVVVNKIIKRIEERYAIDDLLLRKTSTLSKKNIPEIIRFNKILLKQLRNYLHGYHTCGRHYDFRKKRDGNYTTDIYEISTIDSFCNKRSFFVFSKEQYNISIRKRTESVYYNKRTDDKIIFEYRQGEFKTILNKNELKKFLKNLFDCNFHSHIEYNSSYTKFGKSRVDPF